MGLRGRRVMRMPRVTLLRLLVRRFRPVSFAVKHSLERALVATIVVVLDVGHLGDWVDVDPRHSRKLS